MNSRTLLACVALLGGACNRTETSSATAGGASTQAVQAQPVVLTAPAGAHIIRRAQPSDDSVAAPAALPANSPFAPVDVQELSGKLPTFAGARLALAPTRPNGSYYVNTSWCMDGSDPNAAVELATAELGKLGWEKFEINKMQTEGGRAELSAINGPYLISAYASAGTATECAEGKEQVLLAATVRRQK